jgi:DCN1-like protein 1/2
MSSSQRKALKDFRQITGANDKVAKDCMARHGYKLDQAMDYYFNNRSSFPSAKSGDQNKIKKIFDKYCGEGDDADTMCEDKLEEYMGKVGINMESAMPMALAWKLKAENIGEFSRNEFCTGWGQLGADTMTKMKDEVKSLTVQLKGNNESFKTFYRWVFEYAKDEEGRKTLDKDVALEMWNTVLEGHFPLLEKWLNFAVKQPGMKTVTKDLWEQLYEFARDVKPDLSNWEDNGAWPVAVDDFVEMLQESS